MELFTSRQEYIALFLRPFIEVRFPSDNWDFDVEAIARRATVPKVQSHGAVMYTHNPEIDVVMLCDKFSSPKNKRMVLVAPAQEGGSPVIFSGSTRDVFERIFAQVIGCGQEPGDLRLVLWRGARELGDFYQVLWRSLNHPEYTPGEEDIRTIASVFLEVNYDDIVVAPDYQISELIQFWREENSGKTRGNLTGELLASGYSEDNLCAVLGLSEKDIDALEELMEA